MRVMCEKDVINWLDVFQSDRMYLGQAVYWIITKNYNGDVNDWDRAERSLFNALEKKELTAYGSGWTGAYPIPWEVWVGAVSDSKSERPMVSYPDAERGDLGGTLEVGGRTLKGVFVKPAADIKRLWPERKRAACIPSNEKIVEAIKRERSRKDVKTSKGEVVKRVMAQYPGCSRQYVRNFFGPVSRGRPKNDP